MKPILFLTLVLGAITATPQPASPTSVEPDTYTITELYEGFGDPNSAADINDLGQVVFTISSPLEDDVYLWEDGTITLLANDSFPVSLNSLS